MEKQSDIEQQLTQFYSDLLMAPEEECDGDIAKITSKIPKLVTSEHNVMFMRPIESKEVEEAVMQMEKGKALGPDGFTVYFFQNCWDLLKDEILEVVEESRWTGRLLSALNATFLPLILKEQGADSPSKFRPISLCNVILKIITKVMENRLKPLMPGLISPEKSGFVEGRQILDGIILTQ